MPRPIRIFISYAHEDRPWCEKLLDHIGPLRHFQTIEVFDDSRLELGREWDARLKAELGRADILIALLTSHFAGSRYCTIDELTMARSMGLHVVPILVDHVDYGALRVGDLQILPQDDNRNLLPLTEWPNPNKPLAAIARSIREAVEKREAGPPRSTDRVENGPREDDRSELSSVLSELTEQVKRAANQLPESFAAASVAAKIKSAELRTKAAGAGKPVEPVLLGELGRYFVELARVVGVMAEAERPELAALHPCVGAMAERLDAIGVSLRRDETTPSGWPPGTQAEARDMLANVGKRIEDLKAEAETKLERAEEHYWSLVGEVERPVPSWPVLRSEALGLQRSLPSVADPGSTLGRLTKGATALATHLREAQEQVIRALPDLAIFRDLADGPEMVVIPAGSFLMGSPEDEVGRRDDEGPQHRVSLSHFALGRYLVTFEEYDRYCAATSAEPPKDEGWGRGRRPVMKVSWDGVKEYCAWFSGETGKAYRLPSEAEWEYAARAGTATRYSWGDREPDAKLANFGRNVGRTTEVGSYAANPWKLHDMHGNVWEWCEDTYHESYADMPSDGRAWVSGNGDAKRVLRGGSWNYGTLHVRSAYRYAFSPGTRYDNTGFRLARVLE